MELILFPTHTSILPLSTPSGSLRASPRPQPSPQPSSLKRSDSLPRLCRLSCHHRILQDRELRLPDHLDHADQMGVGLESSWVEDGVQKRKNGTFGTRMDEVVETVGAGSVVEGNCDIDFNALLAAAWSTMIGITSSIPGAVSLRTFAKFTMSIRADIAVAFVLTQPTLILAVTFLTASDPERRRNKHFFAQSSRRWLFSGKQSGKKHKPSFSFSSCTSTQGLYIRNIFTLFYSPASQNPKIYLPHE